MTQTISSTEVTGKPSTEQVWTVWGHTPREVHDRFWAAFGVQVVRRQEKSEIVAGAELYLLCEPGILVLCRLAPLLDSMYWIDARALMLRIRDSRPRAYREVAVTDDDRLVRFERIYRDAKRRSARIAITKDLRIARLWQNAPDDESPWRWLRRRIGRRGVVVRPAPARLYDGDDDAQVMSCLLDMMRYWKRPETTIGRARTSRPAVSADVSAEIDPAAKFVGPVWIGAGRRVEAGQYVVGPAVLWDDPSQRPSPSEIRWPEIEPSSLDAGQVRKVRARAVPGKRAFDIAFSLAALALTSPLYPLVALAILLEDGRPIFFAHRRETVGGREFPCIKFRSMRKDADAMKAELVKSNQADGPQFYMKDDPRATWVGKVIRKLQVDELPQFLNVLAGHMSVVGPRPSPYKENQFCPPWREARLSVRPGITGLWQVSRTRQEGLDFQEWIRYDLEYVESASWALDLSIIFRTVRMVFGGGSG